MLYVRIISVEALKLLARPITEFFSAHLIRNWSIACVSAPFSFVYFSQVYPYMLPLRWLRRLMAILHVCLSVLHARIHTLGGFGFACIAQGENLHAFTLTLTCNSHLGN